MIASSLGDGSRPVAAANEDAVSQSLFEVAVAFARHGGCVLSIGARSPSEVRERLESLGASEQHVADAVEWERWRD